MSTLFKALEEREVKKTLEKIEISDNISDISIKNKLYINNILLPPDVVKPTSFYLLPKPGIKNISFVTDTFFNLSEKNTMDAYPRFTMREILSFMYYFQKKEILLTSFSEENNKLNFLLQVQGSGKNIYRCIINDNNIFIFKINDRPFVYQNDFFGELFGKEKQKTIFQYFSHLFKN